MKVAVDLSFIRPDYKNGGTETYIKNLMKGWIEIGHIENFVFFIHADICSSYHKQFPECNFVQYNISGKHKVRTIIFQTFLIPAWIKKYKIDILFYPTYISGFYPSIPVPVVINPHDIQFKFYPEYFSPIKKWYLHAGYKHSLKKADKIVTITNYVKSTLLSFYPKECGGKITTIYNPIDFSNNNPMAVDGIGFPWILSVSSIEKHKNMITLIKAFREIADMIPHNLVIVGCKGTGTDEIVKYIAENCLANRIILTGYITDGQLNWLYQNADLYITTSMYEGFGMTPVEAIGRGIKTIISNIDPLLEVTLGFAYNYYPVNDFKALGRKIKEVLDSSDEKFPKEKATAIKNQYSKEIISNQYYQLFKNIYEESS